MAEEKNTEHGEFLVNKRTLEIHHIPRAVDLCQLSEIQSSIVSQSLEKLRLIPGSDLCKFCFASKR